MILFDDVDKVLRVTFNHIARDPIPKANKTSIETYTLLDRQPLTNECAHFIECCKTGSKPITDGMEGIEVLKVLMAADNLLNPITVHNTALVDDGSQIGHRTKIWHYTHVTRDAIIGTDCTFGQNCYVAGIMGNGCKVQNNVSIYKGVIAKNNVFFGPSCTLTNDINPRCEHSKNGDYMETIIEDGVTIGANATIICGHTIGRYALIGAGAVVTKDVEPYSIMVGNPAQKIGTIDREGNRTLN